MTGFSLCSFGSTKPLGNMFQFKRDFEEYYCGMRDLTVPRNPELQTFDAWLARNEAAIPIGRVPRPAHSVPIVWAADPSAAVSASRWNCREYSCA